MARSARLDGTGKRDTLQGSQLKKGQRMTSRLLLIPLLLLLVACPAMSDSSPGAKKASTLRLEATVVFVSLDGGFYGLVSTDGHRFDPVNLPAPMRQNGLKVLVKARLLPPSAGTHMWGRRIEISSIRQR